MFIGILLIFIGIFVAINPYIAWFILIGWQIKDSEPTDIALIIYRVAAVLKIFIGFFVIITGGFSS
jgi:hypothetical protein